MDYQKFSSHTLPQAKGEGAGKSLAAMSLTEIQGVAASSFDPFARHILQENDPRAQALLAQQAERVRQAQGKRKWSRGDRAFHAKRAAYGVVINAHADGKRVEMQFQNGERALVKIVNLQKV